MYHLLIQYTNDPYPFLFRLLPELRTPTNSTKSNRK